MAAAAPLIPVRAGAALVITGAAGGLGSALAEAWAAGGGRAALIDREEGALAALARRLPGAVALVGDIRSGEGCRELFARAVAALGRIDGLANVAGVYPRLPLTEIDDRAWSESFEVNVRGTYHMMALAAPHMAEAGGGRIVNVASIDAFKAHPANAHYAAMKAAVVSLTRSFALGFARHGVLVNAVAPGPIATPRAVAAGFLPEIAAEVPLGRAARPTEIVEAMLFLLSEANGYTTGETLVVGGGAVMR